MVKRKRRDFSPANIKMNCQASWWVHLIAKFWRQWQNNCVKIPCRGDHFDKFARIARTNKLLEACTRNRISIYGIICKKIVTLRFHVRCDGIDVKFA